MKKNVIVAQLGRTASRWQNKFLRSLGLKSFHEPIGGWQPLTFDTDLSWSLYLNTRMSCRPSNFIHDLLTCAKFSGKDLREVINNREFIEVGYASLPYITNVPCDWKLIGVVRNPQTWIYSATKSKFFYNHISWQPTTFEDYAKVWSFFTKKIVDRCERVYRCEDFNNESYTAFAQEFGVYRKVEPLLENLSDKHKYTPEFLKMVEADSFNWWSVVEELANYFDYKLDENIKINSNEGYLKKSKAVLL